jgi:ribonuclease HII
MPPRRTPDRSVERRWRSEGADVIVGVEEVGRGAWAGPLMVGAAIVAPNRIVGVRDSKMLTEAAREKLFPRVAAWCQAWAVGAASQDECDALGMSAAQKLAARRAIDGLGLRPDVVLIDGNWDFTEGHVHGHTVEKVVKGDARCLSIAAASVVAKVTRDRHMREEAEHYPPWSFDTNKGYPCPVHKAALAHVGPSAIHRRTWVCMEHLPWPGLRREVSQQLALLP